MRKEIDALKKELKEKCENEPDRTTKKGNHSDPVIEIIEEIRHDEDTKLMKVSFKKSCILKEITDQNLNAQTIQKLIDEYELTRMFTHRNILNAYDILINDEKLPTAILFEYCPTNLEDAVKNKRLSKVQQVFAIYQIAEGMRYIHSHNAAHQNLIPSKIFISEDGTIKIGGFEKCQLIRSDQLSLELKLKEMDDVFSFGEIVFFILTEGEVTKIENETVLNSISLLAQQLIDACWSSQPERRPTFEIICDILEKNKFSLIPFSQQEINEISQMFIQYKKYY